MHFSALINWFLGFIGIVIFLSFLYAAVMFEGTPDGEEKWDDNYKE